MCIEIGFSFVGALRSSLLSFCSLARRCSEFTSRKHENVDENNVCVSLVSVSRGLGKGGGAEAVGVPGVSRTSNYVVGMLIPLGPAASLLLPGRVRDPAFPPSPCFHRLGLLVLAPLPFGRTVPSHHVRSLGLWFEGVGGCSMGQALGAAPGPARSPASPFWHFP